MKVREGKTYTSRQIVELGAVAITSRHATAADVTVIGAAEGAAAAAVGAGVAAVVEGGDHGAGGQDDGCEGGEIHL